MSETLWHMAEDDDELDRVVDIYWLLGGFLDHVEKFYRDVVRFQEFTTSLLEREDTDLYRHLVRIEALQCIPFEMWFCSCFAGTISDGSIPKYENCLAYT